MMTFNITTNVAFAGKKMSVDRHINYCSFWQVWQSDETFALQKLLQKIDVYSMQVNE